MGQVTFIDIEKKIFDFPLPNEERDFLNICGIHILNTHRPDFITLEIPIEHVGKCHSIFKKVYDARRKKKSRRK